MSWSWTAALMVVVAIMLLVRVVSQWRKALRPPQDADWDARFIAQLRKAGVASFDEHPVDFFFGLPSEQACEEVKAELEAEAYEVDYRPATEGGGWSLHATRMMRVLVPEMQALSKRFTALAEAKGGRYDNWAVGKGLSRRTRN